MASEQEVTSDSLLPLVEWNWLRGAGHDLPTARATGVLAEFQAAIRSRRPVWTNDHMARAGFCKIRRSEQDTDNVDWLAFRVAFRSAAHASGLSKQLSNQLAGVLTEMEENVHLHSGKPRSGLIAFSVSASTFDFAVLDCGRGVLASLRQATEFKNLTDHGQALRTAIQTGSSRYGSGTNHGHGFNGLVTMTSNAHAFVRLRSGDHLLEIDGTVPLATAQTFQRAAARGFLIAVRVPF